MRALLLLPLLLLGKSETETVSEDLAPVFPGYTVEARLWDRTRVDLLGDYAVEVDWAKKWAEGIGQALYYSAVTGKPPGVVLLTDKGEERFVYRCQVVCSKHGIRLWVWDTVKGQMR
tara:strand:- start:43 stop:393 length:351 start_codon:yes stop_codon:yes gene_type:complete